MIFYDGVATIGTAPLINSRATLTVTSLPAGERRIRARYTGDSIYSASNSPAVSQHVAAAPGYGLKQPELYAYAEGAALLTWYLPISMATALPTSPASIGPPVSGSCSGTATAHSGTLSATELATVTDSSLQGTSTMTAMRILSSPTLIPVMSKAMSKYFWVTAMGRSRV